MHINPICSRELMQTARMKKVMFLLFLFNGIVAVFGIFALSFIFENQGKNLEPLQYSDTYRIYSIITEIEFALVLLTVPGMTGGEITGERERQTLDILLSTPMKIRDIIIGKLLTVLSIMTLLFVSCIPFYFLVSVFGGISILEMIEYLLVLMVTTLFFGSIGMLCSSLCKKTAVAVVCTYIVMGIIVVGLTAAFFGKEVVEELTVENFNINDSAMITKVNGHIVVLLLNPLYSLLAMLYNQTGSEILGFGTWKTDSGVDRKSVV